MNGCLACWCLPVVLLHQGLGPCVWLSEAHSGLVFLTSTSDPAGKAPSYAPPSLGSPTWACPLPALASPGNGEGPVSPGLKVSSESWSLWHCGGRAYTMSHQPWTLSLFPTLSLGSSLIFQAKLEPFHDSPAPCPPWVSCDMGTTANHPTWCHLPRGLRLASCFPLHVCPLPHGLGMTA